MLNLLLLHESYMLQPEHFSWQRIKEKQEQLQQEGNLVKGNYEAYRGMWTKGDLRQKLLATNQGWIVLQL